MKINQGQDRIQINSEWYVKESSLPQYPSTYPSFGELMDLCDDIVHSRTVTYEDNDISLTCTYSYLLSDNPSVHDTPLIEYIDKNSSNVTELWDSVGWMWGVYENNFQSINGQIPDDYVLRVRSFIKYLVDNDILRKFDGHF